MDETKEKKQELLYFRITDLWKRLCDLHIELYNSTCDEYSLLLESNIDSLNITLEGKNKTINEIDRLDQLRTGLISETNEIFNLTETNKIDGIASLLRVFQKYENNLNQIHLKRFNDLLIDIIEKIQNQNKVNQLFINKAVLSLKEIREEAFGEKSYSTYNSSGSTA
jgi:flagellar biosynthesis/type III secretory pathway chaperone